MSHVVLNSGIVSNYFIQEYTLIQVKKVFTQENSLRKRAQQCYSVWNMTILEIVFGLVIWKTVDISGHIYHDEIGSQIDRGIYYGNIDSGTDLFIIHHRP